MNNNILKIKNKKWIILKEKIEDLISHFYTNPTDWLEFIDKYDSFISYIKENKIIKDFNFACILNAFNYIEINLFQEMNIQTKKVIVERDLQFNLFQLNYLEYFYSIIAIE
ncbi:hypothetical protein [Spiroplasma endosymbiont of Nebria brevicollis]|uniref:hypothetical protein n=1 Tax=Spiroplasma endosymbiont of Nebria brevicollis TaxID=3066284 RepID=UPI00313E4719